MEQTTGRSNGFSAEFIEMWVSSRSMGPGGIGKSDEGGRRYGIGCAAGGGWRRDGNDGCYARGTQERVFVVVRDDVGGFGEDGFLDWSGGGSGPGQNHKL